MRMTKIEMKDSAKLGRFQCQLLKDAFVHCSSNHDELQYLEFLEKEPHIAYEKMIYCFKSFSSH